MTASIFTDKAKKPTANDLKKALGNSSALWNEIKNYTFKCYPGAAEEWAYPGKNYGWNYRIRDKKRVIIYFMPCDGFFINSLVFGEKATKEALESGVSKEIKGKISSAKVYAEGRGFRIEVKDKKTIKDIKKLINIKLEN